MSPVSEVQSRIGAINARMAELASTARRPAVDPGAFATALRGAQASEATQATEATETTTATAAGTAAGARPAWATAASPVGPSQYDSLFAQATARYQLPQGLLAAVAQQESGMRADAVSPAGAQGLMQLMPGTAKSLGVNPLDPAQAVDGGARYLRQQLDTFGSLDLALAAYNAGPGNADKWGGSGLTVSEIPFPETRAYVEEVLEKQGAYRHEYGRELGYG